MNDQCTFELRRPAVALMRVLVFGVIVEAKFPGAARKRAPTFAKLAALLSPARFRLISKVGIDFDFEG